MPRSKAAAILGQEDDAGPVTAAAHPLMEQGGDAIALPRADRANSIIVYY